GRAQRALALAQVLLFDAAAAALAWWLLDYDAAQATPLLGLAVVRPLVAALAAVVAHATMTLGGTLAAARRWASRSAEPPSSYPPPVPKPPPPREEGRSAQSKRVLQGLLPQGRGWVGSGGE